MISIDFNKERSPGAAESNVELIARHYPYKSFKTYFDSENFLLTNFREMDFCDAVAILKSYDGIVVIVENCNCGYGGRGPHNTNRLLELLKVPAEDAEKYIYNNAIELYFDKSGLLINEKTVLTAPFESREQNLKSGQIYIGNISYSDTENRKMYLINPSGEELFTLLQLIEVMHPMSYNYFTGSDNTRYIDVSILENTLSAPHQHLDHMSFFIIKGKLFDVVVLYQHTLARCYANNILIALGQEPIFRELTLLGVPFMAECDNINHSTFEKAKIFLKTLRDKSNQYHGAVLKGEKQ